MLWGEVADTFLNSYGACQMHAQGPVCSLAYIREAAEDRPTESLATVLLFGV